MYELKTGIEIDASPKRVWEVLSDNHRIGEWNPFVRKMDGDLDVGEPLAVVLTPPGRKPFAIRPTVISCETDRELAWLGKLGITGIFDGEHHFELHPTVDGKTRFVQWEKFTGILVPFTKKMIDGSVRQGFEAMNDALKRRAESGKIEGGAE